MRANPPSVAGSATCGYERGQLLLHPVGKDVDLDRQAKLELIELGRRPTMLLKMVEEVLAFLILIQIQQQHPGRTQQVDPLVDLPHRGEGFHHDRHQARITLPGLPAEDLLNDTVAGAQTIVGNTAGKPFRRQRVMDRASVR